MSLLIVGGVNTYSGEELLNIDVFVSVDIVGEYVR